MDMIMDLEKDYSHTLNELKKNSNFDSFAFQQLSEDTNPEVALKILARFWVTLKESLSAIEKHIQNNDTEGVRKACHKVTGSAELIGFKAYGQDSRSLNTELQKTTEIHSHLDDIHNYLEDGKQLMEQIQTSFTKIQNYL